MAQSGTNEYQPGAGIKRDLQRSPEAEIESFGMLESVYLFYVVGLFWFPDSLTM